VFLEQVNVVGGESSSSGNGSSVLHDRIHYSRSTVESSTESLGMNRQEHIEDFWVATSGGFGFYNIITIMEYNNNQRGYDRHNILPPDRFMIDMIEIKLSTQ
jgi:hypothetical protein